MDHSSDEKHEGFYDVQGTKRIRTVRITAEHIVYFISLVKSHPCIWDKKDMWYKNNNHTQKAWENISQLMGYSVQQLKEKWCSLTGSFRSLNSKYNKMSPEELEEVGKPTWFAYDAMRFLENESQREAKRFIKNQKKDPAEANETISNTPITVKEPADAKPRIVTLVNVDDNTVICKSISKTVTEKSTRTHMKAQAQLVNAKNIARNPATKPHRSSTVFRKSQNQPLFSERWIETPTRAMQPKAQLIEDPLHIERNVDTSSSSSRASVKSFLSFLEQELCQLSEESVTKAQIEMHRIIADYKLKDIDKSKSQSMPTERKLTESSWTQTESFYTPRKDSLPVLEDVPAMEDMYENSLMADSWTPNKPKRKTDMSQEDCLYFIHLFKKHACLWKRTHCDYRDQAKKHKAWDAMSQITGYSKGELRHKWKSLFSSFRHYRAIYNKSKKMLGTKGARPPKWFAYKALSFLDQQVQDNRPPSPDGNSEEDMQSETDEFATYFLEPKLEPEPPEIEDVQIEMLEPEATSKTVTLVNIHDKTVVCKTVAQPETKKPRLQPNLPTQNVNDPQLKSYAKSKRQDKPFPLSEDPLQIVRENQPTGSTEKQTPFRSFANLIEQELCHLSKEHAAMAQMDIYRIIGEYKLKDIRQCTSNSKSADTNSMESSPTRTEPVQEC